MSNLINIGWCLTELLKK